MFLASTWEEGLQNYEGAKEQRSFLGPEAGAKQGAGLCGQTSIAKYGLAGAQFMGMRGGKGYVHPPTDEIPQLLSKQLSKRK